MPLAVTWMDLEIIILSEVSQKEKQMPYDITYMWNLKYDTNEQIYKTQTYRHREQTCGCRGGWGGGEKDWELWISRCKLVYIGWINNKVLLYSTGN